MRLPYRTLCRTSSQVTETRASARTSRQLPKLLIGQVDVLTTPAPRPDAMLELGKRCVFRVTACERCRCGSLLYEVNRLAVAIVVKVEQNARYDRSIDRALWSRRKTGE
jgi:hypothetical protein